MRLPFRRLLPSLVLALAATGVHAQSVPADSSTVLPVWNHATGKVEALLLLEPASEANIGARLRFSESALDATFGLSAGDSLGLLCDRKAGISTAIGNLANHCMLAALGDDGVGGSRRASLGLGLSRPGSKVAFSSALPTATASHASSSARYRPSRGRFRNAMHKATSSWSTACCK